MATPTPAGSDRSEHASASALPVTLNVNVRGLGPSATLAINERSAELAAQGHRVFRFGLGQSPFPVPAPVVAALEANAHQKDYLPVRGLRALRAVVADYHNRLDGLTLSADDIIIGPGSKELMFILQLVHDSELVIPAPSWVSYAPQAEIIGRPVRWVDTRPENDWRLLPEELERVCAEDPSCPRLLILNYPNNPTGTGYSAEQLRELAEVARRFNVLVLSDEIYGGVDHRGEHVSIARFYPEGTIISGGLSKWCGAGGWRVGTFAIPANLRWLLDAMAVVASETFTSVSAPIQYASVAAFEGGPEIDGYLRQSRRILKALGEHCWTRLTDAGLTLPRPTGGFYLFPDFSIHRDKLAARGIADSHTLCERLLEETGVAALPGSVFGRPSTELTIRMAYVELDGDAALSAAAARAEQELDRDFLARYCPQVVEGIDSLVDWLNS